MFKKIINFLFGKLTYKKFLYSKLNYNQLNKEDLNNIVQELKSYNLSSSQIEYILRNKKNIFYCYRISLKDFPVYFYDDINQYIILLKNYISNNNISRKYHSEIKSILKTYFKSRENMLQIQNQIGI